MKQRLPIGNFKWDEPTSWNTEKVMGLSDDSETGFIFEVDLLYSSHLHDDHNDLPLAPEQVSVGIEMLSPFSKMILYLI